MNDAPQSRKRYEWEQPLIDALIVGDTDVRSEKVTKAESVIRKRICELDESAIGSRQPDLSDESSALHEALRTIESLKRL